MSLRNDRLNKLESLFRHATTSAPNEIQVLVAAGDDLMPGDEVYDNDFEKWELIQKPVGKVKDTDVVRRRVFDPMALLRTICEVYDLADRDFKGGEGPWWSSMDVFISEAKRRLGQKTLELYTRED